jgi:hypothetical protein
MNLSDIDIENLRFGRLFNNAKCLTNGEVYLLLNNNNNKHMNECSLEILNYVKRFIYHKKTKNVVFKLRKELLQYRLREFEIAYLCNLLPSQIDEALALIPSLSRLPESMLLKIIKILVNYSDELNK